METTFLSFLEERALSYIVVARLTSYLKSRLYQVTEWQAIDQIYCVTEFHFKLWNLEDRAALCRGARRSPNQQGGRWSQAN